MSEQNGASGTSVNEARVEKALASVHMAIEALTCSDYVSARQLAHAAEHLSDALVWLHKASPSGDVATSEAGR